MSEQVIITRELLYGAAGSVVAVVGALWAAVLWSWRDCLKDRRELWKRISALERDGWWAKRGHGQRDHE